MIRYEPFYRRFGVFRREDFPNPPTASTIEVEFPTGSVFHYLPEDPKDVGPEESWWMIRNTEGTRYVQHVDDMVTDFGNVTRVAGSFTEAVQRFHRMHRDLAKVIALNTVLGNAQSSLVINYAMAQQFWKYTNNRNLEFQRNSNVRLTIWKQIGEWATQVDRQHFIPITVPSRLPSLQDLIKAERRFDQEGIRRFSAIDKQFILDLWLWFGPNREQSVIAKLPQEALSKINLVFVTDGYWYVMNLATVEPWRKTENNPKGQIDPLQMQRRFLRAVMTLVERSFTASQEEAKAAVKKPDPSLTSDMPPSDGIADLPMSEPDFWSESSQTSNLLKNLKSAPSSVATTRTGTSSPTSSPAPQPTEAEQAAADFKDDAEDLGKVPEEMTDEAVERDLAALNEVEQIQSTELVQSIMNPNEDPLTAGIVNRAKVLAKDAVISGAEYRRLVAQADKYKSIKNPFGPGLLHEAIQVTPEEEVIKATEFVIEGVRVPDKSMLKSSHKELTGKYVTEVLDKHVAQMVLSVQRAGVIVTDYQVSKTETAAGATQTTRVKLAPIGGAATTFAFTHPVVDEDGTFKYGGTRYRQSWQRGDVPIRKVSPHRVVLTSFYGKIAVTISDRSVFNYGRWLNTQIMASSMEAGSPIKNPKMTNVFDQSLKTPKVYSSLSHAFHTLQLGNMLLNFKHSEVVDVFGEAEVKKLESTGAVLAGVTTDNRPVVIDKNGVFQIVTGNKGEAVGTFEEIAGFDRSKAPTEVAMIKVLGQTIPLGVVMAYYLGLSNLIQLLGVEHRRVLQGDRQNLLPHESSIRFSDETLVYSTKDIKASLLLSGFKFYHQQIKQSSIYAFDKPDAFVDLLDASARNTRYTSELKLLNDMFIDPITEEMLKQRKEPTTWFPLIMRAAELLTIDWSPQEMDGAEMVFRGYQRFAGAVYKELVQGLRTYNQRSRLSKTGIDIKPSAVWMKITNDPAIRLYDDTNPVQQLRSDEIATYIGEGGRSKRTMVARTRRFHKNDEGTVSEAGVDSGDVGVNIYLSADPQIVDIYGTTKRFDPNEGGPTPMLSTSALLSPGADFDDPKRVNFISIQHGSGIAAVGYKPLPYRTGYDTALAHRVGKKFSYVAKGEGEVVAIKGGVLKVRYDDGTTDGVEIGRQFTSGAGHMYPNDLVTTVKQGDHVKTGDVLVYNSGFFQPDYFNPRQVIYKAGAMARVALLESPVTHEDSSEFSANLSKDLRAYETEVRSIVLPFDTVISKLVGEGQKVDTDSILCVLEDSTSEAAGLFDESTIDTLSMLVNQSPRAKVTGQIDKIEVLYNGDVEDMSPSLREVVDASDANFARVARGLGKGPQTGRVDESMRIEGIPLALDTLVIRIYVTHGNDAYTGDKAVFAHQMKSVSGGVMTGIAETESGLPIDAKFSDNSNEARLVRSSRRAGLYNSLLRRIGREMVAAYRG